MTEHRNQAVDGEDTRKKAEIWWPTDLEDWQSLSEDCREGDGSFTAHQAVAKVDHLHIPQVSQSLRGRQEKTVYRKQKHTGKICAVL